MYRAIAFLLVFLGLSVGLASAQVLPDGRIGKIASTKTVKVAYRADAAPFSFLSPQQEPVGYTIDLCKLIVRSLEKQLGIEGLKAQWVPVTTQSRFEAVANGNADMECGSSTITLGRMKQVDFSNAIFVETTGVVAKTASDIKTAANLANKKIAVIAGTTNMQALEKLKQQGKISATLLPVANRAEAVAALNAGTADAFASDKLLLVGTDFRDANAFTLLPEDFSFEPYGIVLPRGDWALRLAVNTGLAQIYRDGQAVEIFKKWFEQIGLRPSAFMIATYQLGALPD